MPPAFSRHIREESAPIHDSPDEYAVLCDNTSMQVITHTAEETQNLAAEIGSKLGIGDCILIEGVLGAGKTTFVQGLARGMGLSAPVTSPTFVLVHEYREGAKRLYHLDPYRLDSTEEIADLGFDELVDAGTVVVEWAGRLGPLTPEEHLKVLIRILPDDRRSIEFIPAGTRYADIVGQMRKARC